MSESLRAKIKNNPGKVAAAVLAASGIGIGVRATLSNAPEVRVVAAASAPNTSGDNTPTTVATSTAHGTESSASPQTMSSMETTLPANTTQPSIQTNRPPTASSAPMPETTQAKSEHLNHAQQQAIVDDILRAAQAKQHPQAACRSGEDWFFTNRKDGTKFSVAAPLVFNNLTNATSPDLTAPKLDLSKVFVGGFIVHWDSNGNFTQSDQYPVTAEAFDPKDYDIVIQAKSPFQPPAAKGYLETRGDVPVCVEDNGLASNAGIITPAGTPEPTTQTEGLNTEVTDGVLPPGSQS